MHKKHNYFVALFNGSREISKSDYHRAEMENGFYLNDEGVLVNSNKIIFPKALSDWGKITHFALYVKSVKKNFCALRGMLDKLQLIKKGNTAVFLSGSLEIIFN